MAEWKEIRSEDDINEIMETCNYFHDSCIVSANYYSGASVNEEGAMGFGQADDRKLIVVFHSQWDPRTFELCFSGVRQMHLVGWQDNYFCEIVEAGLSFYNDILPGTPSKLIVWTDYGSFNPAEAEGPLHEPADTYIVSNSLKWRILE